MKRRPARPRQAAKRRAPPAPSRSTHANTNTLLQQGVELLRRQELDSAKICFEQALAAGPNNAVAMNCLGIVARVQRRVPEAISWFEKAIHVRPNFAEAHNNLGNAQRDAGKISDAESCYRQALAWKPECADAHNNLGVVLQARGQISDALRCYEEAIRLNPAFAEAHNNLANVLRQQGQLLDAMASFQTALQLRPHSPEIQNNLGNVFRELGQLDRAEQLYRQAVTQDPAFVEAYTNLGNTLIDLERADIALTSHQEAVRLQPNSVEVLLGLGHAYRIVGDTEQAAAVYERLGTLEPHTLEHRLQSAALCPVIFESRQEMDDRAARAVQQWCEIAHESRLGGGWKRANSLAEPSFNWQFLHGNLRPLKETYAQIFADDLRVAHNRSIVRHSRPRLGIVVTDGHEGLFVRSLGGVIQRIGQSNYELAIICSRGGQHRLRQRILHDLEYVNIPSNVELAASILCDSRFDVLYYWEIGTDATNYFLPFHRCSPIQCTSWGVQVTSGISSVDYYLTSELIEPADAKEHYTEKLLLAPTLLTYQSRPPQLESTLERASLGLTADQHLYVCAQQPGKFHPDFDELLAEVLRQDPRGCLVIAGDRYGCASELLLARMERTMADVVHQVVLLRRLEYGDYLKLLEIADVVLDPPYFAGVNSSYDAFACGQPIVTLPSPYHRGRYTAGCYRKMGVAGGLAASRTDYVRIAVAIANEPDLRCELQRQIREANSALFEDRTAVEMHDQLFQELIERSRSCSA